VLTTSIVINQGILMMPAGASSSVIWDGSSSRRIKCEYGGRTEEGGIVVVVVVVVVVVLVLVLVLVLVAAQQQQ